MVQASGDGWHGAARRLSPGQAGTGRDSLCGAEGTLLVFSKQTCCHLLQGPRGSRGIMGPSGYPGQPGLPVRSLQSHSLVFAGHV